MPGVLLAFLGLACSLLVNVSNAHVHSGGGHMGARIHAARLADERRKHHRHHHHAEMKSQAAQAPIASSVATDASAATSDIATPLDNAVSAALSSKDDLQPVNTSTPSEEAQHPPWPTVAKAVVPQVTAVQSSTKLVPGHILVNGPLPENFKSLFVSAVAEATKCDPREVHVLNLKGVAEFLQLRVASDIAEVDFEAPSAIVKLVEGQAGSPESKLAKGKLHNFLVADDDDEPSSEGQNPVQEKGIDVDTQMPYGELEPFGREDTASELTVDSIKESDEMVDQLERAEVAEEKRSVFRALTRLRGAAITSFDGIARSQTGNIDEYNRLNKWRKAHPLHHLADEESDISKWAFPNQAD